MHSLFTILTILLLQEVASAFTGFRATPTTRLFSSSTEATESLSPETEQSMKETLENTQASAKRRVAVLLCPAQFCVPDDYQEFFTQLSELASSDPDLPLIETCRVAPLPRTEWIKVAQNLPTRAFLEGRLPVVSTLSWYFQAMEKALAEIFEKEGHDVNICMIGHSIGGWVARAYLGGLSQSSTAVHRLAMQRCTSLITLGTPHVSPTSALVDQTRGLLNEIEDAPSCKPQALVDRGIDITCVSSSGLSAKFLTLNVEELVAASSYLPLLGKMDGTVQGDGIVPLDLAFMEEPARRVVLETCSLTNERVRHSHVVPTPFNLIDGYAPSISLPQGFPSYVSEGVVPSWAKYIR